MNVRKILYIDNVGSINSTSIYKSAALAAQACGFEFHVAFNAADRTEEKIESLLRDLGVIFHQIDFIRNPLALGNIKAYRQVAELIAREEIDFIHCNSPIGGVVGRLAGKKCGVKKVIYQAHGFHFYKGAPKFNWLVYYSIERWLARYTDALVTINQEDYELAKNKFKLRGGGRVYYVPGVGVDTSQYNLHPKFRDRKRFELGLRETDIALISTGDLIKRKNYTTAIQVIAETKNPELQYFICGNGPEEANLKALAKELGVSSQIHFLGYRSDINELLAASDIFLFTTKQEGLSRSMMEAMASGLPCVVSRIRGNVDLIEDGLGGYTCPVDDVEYWSKRISLLLADDALIKQMSAYNRKRIEQFDIVAVKDEMTKIYQNELR